MSDDYLELSALTDYYGDEDIVDLWVVMKDGDTIVCRNATSAIRYRGWWSISHKIADFIEATALITADSVQYFNLVYRKSPDSDTDKE